MSAYTWRFITNDDKTCEAIILQDGMEVERETLEDGKAANKWVGTKLRELGAL